MSQENVELVREGWARWHRDFTEFFIANSTPDVELFSRFGSLTGEPYRGHAGVREWKAETEQNFDVFEPWLDEIRDLGDKVLALGGIRFRARGSEADMEHRMAWIFEVEKGRVRRLRFYDGHTEALEALGLRE
jgi:ketosteroid isomerase-like protein